MKRVKTLLFQFAVIGALAALVSSTGCESKKVASHVDALDSAEYLLKQADENLAVDPGYLQKRVDTMKAQLLYIDSLVPGLAGMQDERGIAYNTYRSSLKTFEDYLEAFDPFLLENQFLMKRVVDIRQELKLKSGSEREALIAQIPEIQDRSYANFVATKTLIRAYLDALRPFQRKRKIVDQLFLKLVEKNSPN